MAILSTTMTVVFADSAIVLELTSVGVSGTSRPTVKVTHLTTSGNYDEFLAGDYTDPGQLDLESFLSPKTYGSLLIAAPQQITVSFRLEAGDATPTTYVFQGVVTSEDFAAALDESITSSLAAKVLSTPVLTAGSI